MHNTILIFADFIVISLAYLFALLLRFKGLINVVGNQWFTIAFLLIIFLMLFYFSGLFNHLLYAQKIRLFFRIIKVWLIGLLIYVIFGFLTKFNFQIESRGFIFSFYVLLLLFFLIIRLTWMPRLLENYFSSARRKKNVNMSGRLINSK